jgi:hypothetical protein
LVAEQEGFSAITDKHIPQRPVSPVEATSYTVVIIAGNEMGKQLLARALRRIMAECRYPDGCMVN